MITFGLTAMFLGRWWMWALISPDGVAPSQMVSVSASVNVPLHHEVQKFSSGTGWPGWSWKKGRKMVCGVVPGLVSCAVDDGCKTSSDWVCDWLTHRIRRHHVYDVMWTLCFCTTCPGALTDHENESTNRNDFKDDMQRFFRKLMQKSFLAAYCNINPSV